MAVVRSIRDLAARWAGAGGFDAAPQSAPFLEEHVPLTREEHLWANVYYIIKVPEDLAPLRDREDFQALLAEAESHLTEEEKSWYVC